MTFLERTWQLWLDGGWTMIPLALVALFIYGAAVRIWLYLRGMGHERLTEADCRRRVEQPDAAPGPVGDIVRYTQDGVKSLDQIQDRFSEVLASKIPEVDRRAQFLNVLIGAAPLLGLLGTVLGMLTTFQAISIGGGKTVDMIASGISEALITTEVGLLIALPGMMLAFFIKRKRNEYVAFIMRLEKVTLDRFKPVLRGATCYFRKSDFNKPDSNESQPPPMELPGTADISSAHA